MSNSPISRFDVPAIEDLPDDIRTRMLEVQEKAGFIPNVFLALAYRPDEFRAFFAYHDALMERDSGLSKAEREMIVVATSGANEGDAQTARSVAADRPADATARLAQQG